MTGTDRGAFAEEFVIRPPRQERSRRAWARVLEAGVALFEEGGYDAFTIAAVCKRARVAPRAIYDRTPSKESLFTAVYEYRVSQFWEETHVFEDGERWAGLDGPELVAAVFTEIADFLHRHEAFLSSLMSLSLAGHAEVSRRARHYSQQFADRLFRLLLTVRPHITHPDPEAAVRVCFNVVHSALVMRIGYGPTLVPSLPDRDAFVRHLVEMAVRYLLGHGPDSGGLPWPGASHRSPDGRSAAPGVRAAVAGEVRAKRRSGT